MAVIYCYFEMENYRALKCHKNNSSYFEIRAPLFKRRPIIRAAMKELQNEISYFLEWKAPSKRSISSDEKIVNKNRSFIDWILQNHIIIKSLNNFQYYRIITLSRLHFCHCNNRDTRMNNQNSFTVSSKFECNTMTSKVVCKSNGLKWHT